MMSRIRGTKPKCEAGIITVEACISLPIFLSFFFLLLFVTKVACILVALDHAASQTASHLATASYPLTFVNEYIDERIEEVSIINFVQPGSIKLTDAVSAELKKDSLAGIVWGSIKNDTAQALFQAVKRQVPENSLESLDSVIKDIFLTQYESLTNAGKNQLAGHLVNNYLDFKHLNPDNLTIRLVELPKGEAEFNHRKADLIYQEIGLIPERDFNRDDVVIQLEYEINIPIPFFQDRSAKLRATAIERAWSQGGNGIYTSKEEGLDWLKKGQEQKYVYKARTGIKYHTKKDCAYLQKSCITITKEEAEKMGLTLHDNCPNRF